MTYRERREARAARLRGWADKRQTTATSVLQSQPELRHDWAFITQPGHIPERARMNARDERAYESLNKAAAMDNRAAGIEQQLNGAIYSDDPDAIEALTARIAVLEAHRDRLKRYNASARKGTPDRTILDDSERADLLSCARAGQVGSSQQFPAYSLGNLGADIRRNVKRLEELKAPYRPRTIYARFDGTCEDCGEPVKAQTLITEITPGTWIHGACAEKRGV